MNKLINNYKNQSFLLLIVSILAVSCTTDHFVNSKDGLKIAYSKYGNGSDLIVLYTVGHAIDLIGTIRLTISEVIIKL